MGRLPDETWALARGDDAAALRRAGDALLGVAGDGDYDGHRAKAFALAIEGDSAAALAELNAGWDDDVWPTPAAYSADVARIRYLAGEESKALDALHLAARSTTERNGSVAELAELCVARAPQLWRKALGVAAAGGSPAERAQAGVRVLRARFRSHDSG